MQVAATGTTHASKIDGEEMDVEEMDLVDAQLASASDGGGVRNRSGSTERDVSLREVADDALRVLTDRMKKPLGREGEGVLKSAETLIWSYVATMEELSTLALRSASAQNHPERNEFEVI